LFFRLLSKGLHIRVINVQYAILFILLLIIQLAYGHVFLPKSHTFVKNSISCENKKSKVFKLLILPKINKYPEWLFSYESCYKPQSLFGASQSQIFCYLCLSIPYIFGPFILWALFDFRFWYKQIGTSFVGRPFEVFSRVGTVTCSET
jgi:hypothetical protein